MEGLLTSEQFASSCLSGVVNNPAVIIYDRTQQEDADHLAHVLEMKMSEIGAGRLVSVYADSIQSSEFDCGTRSMYGHTVQGAGGILVVVDFFKTSGENVGYARVAIRTGANCASVQLKTGQFPQLCEPLKAVTIKPRRAIRSTPALPPPPPPPLSTASTRRRLIRGVALTTSTALIEIGAVRLFSGPVGRDFEASIAWGMILSASAAALAGSTGAFWSKFKRERRGFGANKRAHRLVPPGAIFIALSGVLFLGGSVMLDGTYDSGATPALASASVALVAGVGMTTFGIVGRRGLMRRRIAWLGPSLVVQF